MGAINVYQPFHRIGVARHQQRLPQLVQQCEGRRVTDADRSCHLAGRDALDGRHVDHHRLQNRFERQLVVGELGIRCYREHARALNVLATPLLAAADWVVLGDLTALGTDLRPVLALRAPALLYEEPPNLTVRHAFDVAQREISRRRRHEKVLAHDVWAAMPVLMAAVSCCQ